MGLCERIVLCKKWVNDSFKCFGKGTDRSCRLGLGNLEHREGCNESICEHRIS